MDLYLGNSLLERIEAAPGNHHIPLLKRLSSRSAFNAFRAELAQTLQFKEVAGERGQCILDAIQQGDTGHERGSTSAPVKDAVARSNALQDHLADLQQLAAGKQRRDSGHGYESGDESDRGHRAKLRREQLPWADQDEGGSDEQNPNGSQNRQLLRLFSANPSFVVFYIRCQPSAPPGFPRLSGTPLSRDTVNLDNVSSSLYHVHPLKESVGRLGDREITFGAPKPAKTVKNQADWHTAWWRSSVKLIGAEAFSFTLPAHKANPFGRALRILAALVLASDIFAEEDKETDVDVEEKKKEEADNDWRAA
ncbi:hypothetical protein BKA70DRAFT_1234420 [Coprinopsis sp. MPI-PUGE-AT-0042]|nr:hypothetical protein BKA70DRAFT_1234420 [Coprinopsis sp. MPI-PUGE-AT-0042]